VQESKVVEGEGELGENVDVSAVLTRILVHHHLNMMTVSMLMIALSPPTN
jgi:hypothetical protein